MARLHVFSDLHFDASPGGWVPALAPGADIVVCAGDVCEGLPEAFAFLRSFIPKPTPIVTVAGNHSFYNRDMAEEWTRGREAAREHDIVLLENAAAVVGGVRFIGATLWTDYHLDDPEDPILSFMVAAKQMNDHRLIQVAPGHRWFTPDDAATLHQVSVKAIEATLREPFGGPTVVVTHHAPHPLSIAEEHQGDPLNAAFASDLGWLIRRHEPALWVHGHTHSSRDYRVGATRVLCNPQGYGRENISGFDPRLIVEISTEERVGRA